MDDDAKLYAIGEVARRTGLSVSAIRFYSDAGVVAPAAHTASGHRLYDVHAIARLEFVSTLRELDAGLEDVRSLLDGRVTLTDLATAHLARLEQHARRTRVRLAVLRTIVKQETEAGQVILMHKLVAMSDDERDRLIDEFWNEATEGVDGDDAFFAMLRSHRPVLPDDPSAEQLEAWIELGNLVRDGDFRRAVRDQLRETFATAGASVMLSAEMLGEFDRGGAILQDAHDAQLAGVPSDSPRAGEIATRYVEFLGRVSGDDDTPEFRRKVARDLVRVEELHRESIEEAATSPDPHTRYQSLVATINGTADEYASFMPYAWLRAAVDPSP
ncbi:DNA-binding transcriptional regulator, MerR family [Lentzea fradiae]|uniref:DNA-binding transcriptional regulator, MerR family n=1 Tax=Lentzea fradiae TaxID=200378 RepID=A0A1G7V667_9PSEU|nr:MerR family transcriptional regulator [Lentzea fradiae]SDG55385.1 DNA-binding transcriptional regulator, MerR family [Lentzea fradiae]